MLACNINTTRMRTWILGLKKGGKTKNHNPYLVLSKSASIKAFPTHISEPQSFTCNIPFQSKVRFFKEATRVEFGQSQEKGKNWNS
jgi:hypothetical protein